MVGLIFMRKINHNESYFMKLKKKRLLIKLFILVSGILFSIYFSTIMYFLLIKRMLALAISNLYKTIIVKEKIFTVIYA